jgi:hypothetical protein
MVPRIIALFRRRLREQEHMNMITKTVASILAITMRERP